MSDQGFGQQGFGTPPVGASAPQPGAPGMQIQPMGPGGAPTGEPDQQERMWAMLGHLSYFVLGIIGPLILMLASESIVGKDSAFLKHQAKQALIWQGIIVAIAVFTCGFGAILTIPGMIFAVLAALAANKGEWYVYPLLGSFSDR